MAKRELEVQTHIKKSVIKDGGYSLKLSNRFTIGVPDLGIWLPPFVPFIAEVKDFGECSTWFQRKLDVTPKQRDTMRRMGEGYDVPVCGVMVHAIFEGRHALIGMDRHAVALSYHFPREWPYVVRQPGGYYDITRLLAMMGVPKL